MTKEDLGKYAQYDPSMFYNDDRLMSHNAIYSMVMGERGYGKSFQGKERMLKGFLKNGKQSVYIRRKERELDFVKDNLFDDIQEKYPEYEIETKGYQVFCNGECFCYLIALSTASNYRSVSFPRVDFMMFDEYIPEDGKFLNKGNEMPMLESIINTVFRLRRPKVYLATNNISYVNPFFTQYGIEPKPSDEWITRKFKNKGTGETYTGIALHLTKDNSYRQYLKTTDFSDMISKTSTYAGMSIDNEVMLDFSDYIAKEKPQGYDYCRCALRVGDKTVGVWSLPRGDGGCYIDNKYDPSCAKYTVYSDEEVEGFKSIKIDRNNWNLGYLKRSYLNKIIWYKNQEIKKLFSEISRYL